MMTRAGVMAVLAGALAVSACAQDGDKVTVPFRDASKPRTLVVHVLNGSITIHGYNGNDAIVEGTGPRSESRRRDEHPGMHQISGGMGMDVTEENNVITVRAGMNSTHLTIQVPVQTAIKATTVNGGKLEIDNISGEINAENTNGAIAITNVSGSVLAHSSNGRVTVSLDKVTPGKEMSFASMNGTVDVTLPADVKANVKMRTDNGEIWSDFDVKLSANSNPPKVEDDRKSGGRYRVRVDKSVTGTINGGGPEISFVTYNGNILIHSKK